MTARDYFPGCTPAPAPTLVLLDVDLLLRPAADAPTGVEIVADICARGTSRSYGPGDPADEYADPVKPC